MRISNVIQMPERAIARRGIGAPRRVLVAEDGMREENGGDGTALTYPSFGPRPNEYNHLGTRRSYIAHWNDDPTPFI